MTVAALTPQITYLENGIALAFAIPFRFLSGAITVDRLLANGDVVPLSIGTHYSISGGTTDAGGTLIMLASVAGARLRIRRATPRMQQADYTPGDNFPAESHEAALDRSMMIDQEQDAQITNLFARALLVPDGETFATLPSKVGQNGKFIALDAFGNPVFVSGTGADAGLRADLAAIGGSLVMTEGGVLQAVLDAIAVALAGKITPANLPGFIADAFTNLSASDAGQIRRATLAASVEAMKASALNYNGSCRISQQFGTTAVTDIGENDSDGEELWVIDGHKLWAKGTLRVSSQQVAITDLPGFTHALKVTVTTAQPTIGTDFIRHVTVCENNRFLPLAWGTLNARDMVHYAWVKTSMAGVYDINILNGDRTVARAGQFTVDEPNSWQLVKVHLAGVAFASTWDINSVGYRCEIGLAGGGSPNLAAEVGHYFMMTGQLFLPADYDPGLDDTAMLMPNLQENLIACQRYYQKSYNMSTVPGTAAQFAGSVNKIAEASVSALTVGDVRFGVSMATIPTITVYSSSTGTVGKAFNSNTAADINLTTQSAGANGFHAYLSAVAVTAGHGLSFQYVADARVG
tara:strand:- start:4480 stop:6210 length:1731 start_codon:yes stop_codon:yes gene_type:complete